MPRRQRTPFNTDPDSLRLSRPSGPCQNLPAWTGSLWTVWRRLSPRSALRDPAACSAVAGRAARKGARGSKIGCGSESGLSTRPCRLAGFLRFPHRFTPRVPIWARWLACSVTSPIYSGLSPTIRPSHTQPPTIKSAPRLARYPSGPYGPPGQPGNPPPDGARSSCDHRCRPHIRKIGEHYVGGTTMSFPGAGPQFPRGKGGDSAC